MSSFLFGYCKRFFFELLIFAVVPSSAVVCRFAASLLVTPLFVSDSLVRCRSPAAVALRPGSVRLELSNNGVDFTRAGAGAMVYAAVGWVSGVWPSVAGVLGGETVAVTGAYFVDSVHVGGALRVCVCVCVSV